MLKALQKGDFKLTPVWKTLRPGSIPSVFVWGKESTPWKPILKNPLPEKRHKIDIDEESTLPDESLDEDMLVKHVFYIYFSYRI